MQRTDDKRRAIILDPLVTGAVAEVRVLHPLGIPVSTFTAIQTESWSVADFTLEKAIDDPPVTTAALRQPGEYRMYKKGERVRNTETGKIGVVDRDTLGAWARVRILGTVGRPSDITTDWTLNLVEPADEAAAPEAKSVFQSNRILPLRQQYLNLKAQYPDFVLFYCLGDFYETFDADAEIAAWELDLVLTSRPVSRDQRVPMAGVPYHALEPYVTKLIEKGYSVAVAEQVGQPNGTGIVERRIERVLTPSHSSQTAKTGVLNDLNSKHLKHPFRLTLCQFRRN